jgi:uncharacterized protein (DUF58 family)
LPGKLVNDKKKYPILLQLLQRGFVTIELELPSEAAAMISAKALALGQSVEAYIRDRLLEAASRLSAEPGLTAEQVDRTFEEVADMLPSGVPTLSDNAVSREAIYTREDDWR